MTDETIAARMWDSEKRDSPYSTVADPNADDYCEECDSTVDYSDGSKHGRCKCDDDGEHQHTAACIGPAGSPTYCTERQA